MTDLLIPLASPNPATTDWVPLGNTGSVPTTQPSVRVNRNAAQGVTTGTWTAISWDTVRYDIGPSPHFNIGNPFYITCQVAGTYAISGQVIFQPNSGNNQRLAAILVNGIYVANNGYSGVAKTVSVYDRIAVATTVKLNVGDQVQLAVFQDSGGTINTTTPDSTTWTPELSMALVGGQQGPPGFASPPTYATTLPASPVDGQEAILVDNVTNPTYQWRFRWNAGSTSPYKWEFVGGSTYRSAVTTNETTASSSGTDLATVGPGFVCPRAGDYRVQFWANAGQTAVGCGSYIAPNPIGGAAGSGSYVPPALYMCPTANFSGQLSGWGQFLGMASGVTLRLQYWVVFGGTGSFSNRVIEVTPLRVS